MKEMMEKKKGKDIFGGDEEKAMIGH